ncbi:MAG: hypothetical protein CRN43_06485 [Candidatus Nephrothrix sp. EaCA]|nr:MAG: hypothetical protein CRN43_06485 [Candidatus Nephrothrix sp. EaCA]
MPSSNLVYMPAFRARQQEMMVLRSFDFGTKMYPLIEIIKETERSSHPQTFQEIYAGLADAICSDKVFVDLPVYLRDASGMQDEVVSFNRTVLSDIVNRIEHYNLFSTLSQKVIPVVSALRLKTGEANTITQQYEALKKTFPSVAIRTFTNTFKSDLDEIRALLKNEDFLIYDIHEGIGLTNPVIRKDRTILDTITLPCKVALRSAINTGIQNTRLNHGEIVYEADNSLSEMFWRPLGFNAFGDFAGIKKDDLTLGDTISPGFILYNPADNLYYGYKGTVKNLAEFETTIVPDVLASTTAEAIRAANPDFLNDKNEGWMRCS